MATIVPIRGLRYSAKTGAMSDLVTPPYDVIDEAAQERYYRRHPHNIIRLEYGKIHPDDNAVNNRYTRAAADFLAWQKAGVLVREPVPALYLYEQSFPYNGELKTRRGLLCGVKLEPYARGVVLPHEETLPKHKADRLALMRACRANFSPIFGLFADREKIVEQHLIKKSNRAPDVSFRTENGQQHNLWVITEPETITVVQEALANKRIYIADGHHRYETALSYRNERRALENSKEQDRPYDYVMMTLVNLYDSGLVILPTHRLLRNIANVNTEKLLKELEENFTLERFPLAPQRENFPAFLKILRERGKIIRPPSGTTARPVQEAAGEIETESCGSTGHQHVFGLYCGQDRLYLLSLKDTSFVAAQKKEGHPPAWPNLDVSVLHTLILEKILGIGNEQLVGENYVAYTRKEEGALAAVDAGEYQLAFFLNPPLVEEVIAVATQGGKMPQKSTYFYPKLITGLVINLLE